MFLKLTRPNHQPLYVNSDQILGFEALPETAMPTLRTDKTLVTLTRPLSGVDIIYVNESAEEIMNLLSH